MNRIAHVVLDLPLDEHFDYAIPPALAVGAVVGARVKVSFNNKRMIGFIIQLADEAVVAKVKPIKSVCDTQPIFNEQDLTFARTFADYYGCSLGEALTVMTRHRRKGPDAASSVEQDSRLKNSGIAVHHCPDGNYFPVIEPLIKGRMDVHILVPDASVANQLGISKDLRPYVGLRSSMFEAFARSRLIIVIDDDNASYKQEQSPMYETRDVVRMAQRIYGFDVCFIGASPSVESMQLVAEKKAVYHFNRVQPPQKPVVIDLANYKYLDKGILSPPVRNALQDNINAKRQSVLLLNRRGSFSVTRCVDCGHILKCKRCDAPIAYLRSQKEFVCRHCAYHAAEAGACPACAKTNWKSFGMGVEQLQRELSFLFPTAKIVYFEKENQELPKAFDVLIATQAVFRFKGKLNVQTIVVVEIDSELNRADMRSSFKGWSRVVHARQMAERLMVQTRNLEHHVLKALMTDDTALFYQEELRLRRELEFAPFYHWAAVTVRSRNEKFAQTFAQDVYNALKKAAPESTRILPDGPDTPSKLRDQYRFRVMAGGADVPAMVRLIKGTLGELKRSGKTIVTLNIDP